MGTRRLPMTAPAPETPEELLLGRDRAARLADLPSDDHRLLWLSAAALLGPEWQQPLARVLRVDPRTVRRIAAGQYPVRPTWLRRIAAMLVATREQRADRLAAAEDVTQRLLERFEGEPPAAA